MKKEINSHMNMDIEQKIIKIQKKYKKQQDHDDDFIFVQPQFGNVPTRIPEKGYEKIHTVSCFLR